MDFSGLRTLIIMLLLLGGGYWYHQHRERVNEFEGLEGDTKAIETTLAQRQQEKERVLHQLEPLRKGKKEADGTGTSMEQLEKEIDALRDVLKTTTAQLDAAEAEFQTALQAVREKARQRTFPVIKLASGEELHDCTIKFGEGFISITHRDGNKKAQAEDLPEGWVERYSVDYVSSDAKAEKDALTARVDEAIVPPAELRDAKFADIDGRIAQLNTQLLALSDQMRSATRKSDQLVREAYRIALDKGRAGETAAAKRTAMFSESKRVDAAREEIRKRYLALRDQKLALERQRLELKRKPVP